MTSKPIPVLTYKVDPDQRGNGRYQMVACFTDLAVHVPFVFEAHSENDCLRGVGEPTPCDGSCKHHRGSKMDDFSVGRHHTNYAVDEIVAKALAYKKPTSSKDKEAVIEALKVAGLEVKTDAAGKTQGILVLSDNWSRWTFYYSNSDDSWGAGSEDHSIPDEVADEIEKSWQGTRRGRHEDEKRFRIGKPLFVIDASNADYLGTFVKLIRLIWAYKTRQARTDRK